MRTGATFILEARGANPATRISKYLYRIGMDGTGLQLPTPDSANHTLTLSAAGGHFVDSCRRTPEPFAAKARDGGTVDARIAADRDFDLILLPNRCHGFANAPYMIRRRWDHFVRHLLGIEPPDHTIGAANRPAN